MPVEIPVTQYDALRKMTPDATGEIAVIVVTREMKFDSLAIMRVTGGQGGEKRGFIGRRACRAYHAHVKIGGYAHAPLMVAEYI